MDERYYEKKGFIWVYALEILVDNLTDMYRELEGSDLGPFESGEDLYNFACEMWKYEQRDLNNGRS